MITLAIDPGAFARVSKKENAVALFARKILVFAWHERVDTGEGVAWSPGVGAYTADEVIVERPEYHGARSDSARTQDLIALAWEGAMLAGAYAGRFGAPVCAYGVSEWKGSEAKPCQHARLWKVLDADERAVLGGDATWRAIDAAREKGALDRWSRSGGDYYPRGFKWADMLDAAALGATHLGRIRKVG